MKPLPPMPASAPALTVTLMSLAAIVFAGAGFYTVSNELFWLGALELAAALVCGLGSACVYYFWIFKPLRRR